MTDHTAPNGVSDAAPDTVIDAVSSDLPASLDQDLDPMVDGILMAHQVEWLADKSDLKLAEKGRRTGITFAEALDDTLVAASTREAGGDNVFYIGDTKDKGREFIGYVAHFARVVAKEVAQVEEFLFEDAQADGSTKHIAAFRIRFASGFRVEALSSNPANIRGLQGIVVIDEAAFHRDVRAIIDAVNALLIWGGKVRVISTHNGVLNPFNELILEAKAGKSPFSLHHIPFGNAVLNGLYRRVCMIKNKPWSQHDEADWEAQIRGSYGVRQGAMRQELDAIPAEAEGAALSRVQIEAAMAADIPFARWTCKDDFVDAPMAYRTLAAREWCQEHLDAALKDLDDKRQHVMGEDFARTGDVTSIAIMEIGADLVRRVRLLVELRNTPFDQQREVLFYLLDRVPRFAAGAMDATGNGAYLGEVTRQRYGSRIAEVKFSVEWYRQEMPPYVAAFGDGTLILPRHEDVLQDHQALQFVDGVIRVPKDFRFKGSDGFGRHGDSAVACALAWHASRLPRRAYGYEPVEAAPREPGRMQEHADGRGGQRESTLHGSGLRGSI